MQKSNELKNFIQQNTYTIFAYINTKILKDIGAMNDNYFIKTIQDILNEDLNLELEKKGITTNKLPYFIFTLLSHNGKTDYTSLRSESLDFSQINKEACVYYNYVRFSLDDKALHIELMQSKMGGMAIDEDMVKFRKSISFSKQTLEEFISENAEFLAQKEEYIKMQKAINI